MNYLKDRRHFLKNSIHAVGAICGANLAWADMLDPGAIPKADIDAALGQLDKLIADIMTRTGVPGLAIAVVQGERSLYAKGFGTRDIRYRLPVDADTVFQLASVSKSVGATVVAREVGLGRVSWEQPMRELLPWFTLSDPTANMRVTVGDLYAHRSGLPDHIGDRLEDMGFTQREVLERLRHVPITGFRARYEYTNFGLTAAAEGVARAAGTEWSELSHINLYKPLGMSRTSSRFEDFVKRDNRVTGHHQIDGKWVTNTLRMPDAQAPAASVTSSANDLAKWLSLLIGQGVFKGQRLIDPEALGAALSPQFEITPANNGRSASYYGFGFNVGTTSAGRRTYGHSGAFAMGAATAFKVIPSAGLGIVVLTNGQPIGVPEILCAQFADLIEHGTIRQDYAALSQSFFTALNAPEGSLVGVQRPISPKPAQALHAYVGTYHNDYHGPLQIDVSENSLLATIGGAPLKLTLTHWDADIFTFTLLNENATLGTISKATFLNNAVTLEYYNKEHLGTFVRQAR